MDASLIPETTAAPPSARRISRAFVARVLSGHVLAPLGAVVFTLIVFGVFVALAGVSPLDVYASMYRGAFGTWFSFQNTLLRAAPLMLTGLCAALPARLGLIVIGGEGALVVGGVSAAATAMVLQGVSPLTMQLSMALAAMLGGGAWIGAVGALRSYRGVNETISSLLLTYIAIALLNHLVEGPLKDPASLNKPSTPHIGEANMLGTLPGVDVHWGLVFGVAACAFSYVLMDRSVFGFAAKIVGGNARAARLSGLNVPRLVILACFMGGAAAGLAGMVEVSAVHGTANVSLVAGYGYTGILVAFLARHNPLYVMPVALVLGGINASGGLLQRTFGLPDATVSVLQGILFVSILASESYRGSEFSLARLRLPSWGRS
ncbi:MAG TPA: ABC transporter permease [Polyangiaceae bacterium]|nr:ABC transporter permease [Polyangiaceae bacterium]